MTNIISFFPLHSSICLCISVVTDQTLQVHLHNIYKASCRTEKISEITKLNGLIMSSSYIQYSHVLKCKRAEAEPAFLAGVALLQFVNRSPKYEGNANNY